MGKKAKAQAAIAKAIAEDKSWKGRLARACRKFESVAMAAAAPLPSPRIKLWLAGFFHPEETYDKLGKIALSELFGNLIIFYFAYSAIFLAATLVLTSTLTPDEAMAMGFQAPQDPIWSALTVLVANTIVSAVSVLFAFALIFAAAVALGGKGGYAKQTYAMSLVLCGSNVLLLCLVAAAFAAFIPAYLFKGVFMLEELSSLAAMAVNLPLLLLCLAVLLYSIYAYCLLVKKAHNISKWRAVASMLIAAALVVLIDFVLNRLIPG
jgi:hypothetical protein